MRDTIRVLKIDSSVRGAESVTAQLGEHLLTRLGAESSEVVVDRLDLMREPVAPIDPAWVDASYTSPESRTPLQQQILADSDRLIDQLDAADLLVLGVPLYNFSVPAALKAWIDQICRVGVSFTYTADGSRGLLPDRPVYVVMATGGVQIGSESDFASGYIRQVLGFVGLRDVRLIAAEGVSRDPGAITAALNHIGGLESPFAQAA